jgi:hypothetical protein
MRISLAALAGITFAVGAQAAAAATVTSFSALALGAIVGSYSTTLSHSEKALLGKLLDGRATAGPSKPKINVNAAAVICHASDVDITLFGCELTLGTKKVTLSGRKAHELFATIREAGVSPDAAAGTIFEALHAMSCVIDPKGIAQRDGSGATCNFDPGPS